MSQTRSAVEVTTRYATTVDDLSGAWAFVMDHLDRVGPDPSVTINPVWTINALPTINDEDGDPERPPRHFEVVVSGMVEEGSK